MAPSLSPSRRELRISRASSEEFACSCFSLTVGSSMVSISMPSSPDLSQRRSRMAGQPGTPLLSMPKSPSANTPAMSRVAGIGVLLLAAISCIAFLASSWPNPDKAIEIATTPTPLARNTRALSTSPHAAQSFHLPHEVATTISLKLEAAVDVDGDIQLWRRTITLLMPSDAPEESVALWHEAADRGCGGEMFLISDHFVKGRLTCGLHGAKSLAGGNRMPARCTGLSDADGASSRGCGGSAYERGMVAWLPGSIGTEFLIQTAALTANNDAKVHATSAERPIMELPMAMMSGPASWEALAALKGLPTLTTKQGTMLDPPVQMSVSDRR